MGPETLKGGVRQENAFVAFREVDLPFEFTLAFSDPDEREGSSWGSNGDVVLMSILYYPDVSFLVMCTGSEDLDSRRDLASRMEAVKDITKQ